LDSACGTSERDVKFDDMKEEEHWIHGRRWKNNVYIDLNHERLWPGFICINMTVLDVIHLSFI
jgi:hypothetical protein